MFTLPDGVESGNEEGLRLIWRYYFYERKSRTGTPKVDGIPPAVYQLGAGIVDSNIMLGIGRRRGFSRSIGPGFVQLASNEFIQQVIDLRHHFREMRVEGVTRDGIPLEVIIGVKFMVDRVDIEAHSEEIPYPVDDQAIFKVSYFATVEEGESMIIWSERVAPIAGAALVSELATYPLDEIYPMGLERVGPVREAPIRMLKRVEQQVFKAVEKKLRGHGLTLVDITVSDLVLPEDIHREHITNLQQIWQAEMQADNQRSAEEIRADAIIGFVQEVVGEAENRYQSGGERMSDVITGVLYEIDQDDETDSGSAQISDQSSNGKVPLDE